MQNEGETDSNKNKRVQTAIAPTYSFRHRAAHNGVLLRATSAQAKKALSRHDDARDRDVS